MAHDELEETIRASIEAGHDKEETKRELISKGIGTAGFAEAYAATLQALGKKEPARKVPPHVTAMRNDIGYAANMATVPEDVRLIAAIGFGFGALVRNWRFLVWVSVMCVLPYAAAVVAGTFMGSLLPLALVASLPFTFLIGVLGSTAIVYVGTKGASRVETSYAFAWASSHFFGLLWIALFTWFVTVGGVPFLVVPALFIAVSSLLSLTVLVEENARGSEALMRSLDLTKGILLKSALWMFALGLLLTLPLLVSTFLVSNATPTVLGLALTLLGVVIANAGFLIYFGALSQLYLVRKHARPLFDFSSYGGIKWVYRFLFLCGLAICVLVVISSNALAFLLSSSFITTFERVVPQQEVSQEGQGGFSVVDYLAKSRVETTAASAKLFGGRMGDYTGACNDITVVEPVKCRSIGLSFVVYAPLSNGMWYCTDAKGFTGEVSDVDEYACTES